MSSSTNPFDMDFANLTLAPGAIGGGGGQQPAAAASQPVAPIVAADDPWGLVAGFQQQQPAVAAAAAVVVPQPSQEGGALVPAAAGGALVPSAEQPPSSSPPPPVLPPPASDVLPEGWIAYADQASGREYYCHAASGQVTWDKPEPPPPPSMMMPIAPPPAAAPPPVPEDEPVAVAVATEYPAGAAGAGADPFDVFAAQPADQFALQSQHSIDSDGGQDPAPLLGSDSALPGDEDDFWAQMGFQVEAVPPSSGGAKSGNRRQSTIRASVANIPCQATAHMADDDAGADRLKAGGLPSGRTYEAELQRFNLRLGAVFLTAAQVKPNLYQKVSDTVIEALGNRPVVAYTSADAAAHHAGIHPGDILLKVGERAATEAKQARDLILAAPRSGFLETKPKPLIVKFLRPDLPVIVGENQHLVKYNNAKPRAPSQLKDWKAKYVVVGGIAAQPYALLMYYSKADYDKSVASNLAHRQNPVKVKKFDLRGCTIVENKSIFYHQNYRTLHFFIVMPPRGATEPGTGLPAHCVKICHPTRDGLVPVLESVKRVIAKYTKRPVHSGLQNVIIQSRGT